MVLLLIHLASPIAEGIGRGDEPAMPHQASPQIDTDPLPTEGSPPNLRDQNATDARITELEKELHELRSQLQLQPAVEEPEEEDGIEIGGAVRVQYSWEDYVQGNRERGGDVDFDIFRIDFDGKLGGVLLSAQYRWFQYMDVVHHAWVGYRISDGWELQAGITRVPFGNLDFNSHNFFFSSCYYVGLEDDYDAGIKIVGKHEAHDFRVAFFKTDEMGGIDGFVDNRTDRYSYDVLGIRADGEGTFDPPATALAEYNSVALRYTYQCGWVELGGSWLAGDLRDRQASRGHRCAYAVHSNITVDRWNLQLQFTDYHSSASPTGLLVVGAYSFFDTIPSRAKLYTANLAYELPVECGPVTQVTFYNDFNVMSDKSGGLHEKSLLNVTGVSVAAGGLFAYFDLLAAKNHPFVGGSMGTDAGNWNTRFNVNLGFYF